MAQFIKVQSCQSSCKRNSVSGVEQTERPFLARQRRPQQNLLKHCCFASPDDGHFFVLAKPSHNISKPLIP